MFDDCILLDLRPGEHLVFLRNLASPLPPSRHDLRRILDDLRELDDLAAVVRDLTGDRLDAWSHLRSREETLDLAADLLARCGCHVLTAAARHAFSGRARSSARAQPDPPIPMLSDLGPRDPAQATPQSFVAFDLTTDDGAPIADAQFEIKNTRGFATRCKSDATGHVRTGVPLDEMYSVRVLADLVLPPPPAHADAKRITGIAIARLEDESLDLSPNHRHTLVVPRPRATIVSIDHWVEARPVLLFGTLSQTPDGPTTVRGALRRAFTEAGAGELHVVGHADTQGKADDNEALALERARSVHLYLAGDRAAWADHAFAHADVATLQAALAWAATACGLACDPGPIDDDWGPATAAALDALRHHAGIDPTLPLGADDWAAIFDLYDDDLARILLTDRAGVAAARGRLNLPAPTTMGERWPVHARELADHECPDNRRVDLVSCAAGSSPQPETDELYDGTFLREQLAVPAEIRLRLWVHTPALDGLTGASVSASIAGIGDRRLVADADGIVLTTVLAGDRLRLRRAAPRTGGGYLREFAAPELEGTI